MKVKYKDTSCTQIKAEARPMRRVPSFYAESLSEKSQLNINKKRPLKTNSQNLAFKGLSFNNVSKVVEQFSNELGSSAGKNFKSAIELAGKFKTSGLTIDGDSIKIKEPSFAKRLWDTISYPFYNMHLDITNSIMGALNRLSIFKKSKGFQNLLNSKVLKNRRAHIEHTSNVAAIQNYFEMFEKGEKGFKRAHERFKPGVSNYNSTVERTFTRIVTGSIPAFYLANDAYNLSMYVNNKKDMASKEKKRRFNQELARVGITAASTFGILSVFAKQSNASAVTTTVLMGLVTFVSEIVGRMIVGTPVLPVSSKNAKKYAQIQGKIKKDDTLNTTTNFNFQGTKTEKDKTEKKEEYKEPPKKGKLTFKGILKIMGLLVVAGFGVEKLSNIKSVKKILESLNGKYKNLYRKEFTITRNEFSKLTKKLKENGFDEIAQNYENIIKDQGGETIKLGKTKNKVKHILIHQVLAFPVRFSWDTLMLPYKQIVKPLFNMISKPIKKALKIAEKAKTAEELAKEALKKNQELLRNSIEYLQKTDKKGDFQKEINTSIMSSLDSVTKSNYSNADMSAMVKVVMSAITSAFLIADNYNMVIIDSQGKDKDLAEQKAKERTIQRAVRITYGALVIKLLNGIFNTTYNASLLGAQLVNAFYTIIVETLERKSVGLPITESTREEMIKAEKKNLKAEGAKGKYFRIMAALTGKKPMNQQVEK